MKQRLPVVLSATALVVAVLGVTPVGQATSTAIQTHFAKNANFLRGKAPSVKAGKNKIPMANKAGKLDKSWGAVGAAWAAWSARRQRGERRERRGGSRRSGRRARRNRSRRAVSGAAALPGRPSGVAYCGTLECARRQRPRHE